MHIILYLQFDFRLNILDGKTVEKYWSRGQMVAMVKKPF